METNMNLSKYLEKMSEHEKGNLVNLLDFSKDNGV